MQLDEAIIQLQQAGLIVLQDKPHHIRIAREKETRISQRENSADQSSDVRFLRNLSVLHDICSISGVPPDHTRWMYSKWDYLPGPGPDDVEYEAATLDEVLAIVLSYYFGHPTIIEGWIFPKHKHPEWKVEIIRQALDHAQIITRGEWETIEKQYFERYLNRLRARFDSPMTLRDYFAYLFARVSNERSPNRVLQLRRDLGEAFVVQDSA